MNLTADILENVSERPTFVNTFEFTDADTDTKQVGYGVKFQQMANGESVVLEIASSPETWQETEGNYGPSVKGWFKTKDGITVTSYIRTGEMPLRSEGFGVTLAQRLRQFNEGDIIRVTLEVKQSTKHTDRQFKIYKVEQLESFQ